ncbi:hypothetical protein [Gudongella sp. SC589]|uniref:hypothetical protein n=1 Tax=Gudongella sp. SC589 TaxID=3385990 RepID=UPI0039049E73
MKKRKWTEEEVDYLLANYRKMTYEKIGLNLDRTKSSVDIKIQSLKKKDPDFLPKHKQTKRQWQDSEVEFIKLNLGKLTNAEISLRLKRTHASVQTKIVYLRNTYPELKEIERPRDIPVKKEIVTGEIADMGICPHCKSKRINEVENVIDGARFYCINCLSEFSRYGNPVKPIL